MIWHWFMKRWIWLSKYDWLERTIGEHTTPSSERLIKLNLYNGILTIIAHHEVPVPDVALHLHWCWSPSPSCRRPYKCKKAVQQEPERDGIVYIHLTTTENQTLLGRWNTRLLLDFLLYPCDLFKEGQPNPSNFNLQRWRVPCHPDRCLARSESKQRHCSACAHQLTSLIACDL